MLQDCGLASLVLQAVLFCLSGALADRTALNLIFSEVASHGSMPRACGCGARLRGITPFFVSAGT